MRYRAIKVWERKVLRRPYHWGQGQEQRREQRQEQEQGWGRGREGLAYRGT